MLIGIPILGRHDRLRGLLSPYIDGRLSPAEARRLERHLTTCEACSAELATLKATVGLLSGLPELEAPRSFKLAAEPAPVRSFAPYVLTARLATSVAAVLLVVLLAGDALGLLAQSKLGVEAPAEPQALVDQAPGAATAPAIAPVPAAASAPTVGPVPAPVAPAAPAAVMAAPPMAEAQEENAIQPMGTPGEEQSRATLAAPQAALPGARAAPSRALEEPAVAEDETVVTDAMPKSVTAPDVEKAEPVGGGPLMAEAPVSGAQEVAEEQDRVVTLPLRQIEAAAGSALAVLLLGTLWLGRRRRRLFQ